MRRDFAAALRALRRSPLLSFVIVATLALGIGMNTAIFSVVRAVLLKPLEYREPGRLVHMRGRLAADQVGDVLMPGGSFEALRGNVRRLEGVGAIASIRQNLTGAELPVQVQVGWISTNLFRLLGVQPILGRDFAEGEPPGRLILSHAFWERQFGGDARAIGRSVALDGRAYEVVGVMPKGFRLEMPRLPTEIDVWKAPDDWWQNGAVWSRTEMSAGILRLLGRLTPGASLAEAQAEIDTLTARLREGSAELARSGFAVSLEPLHAAVVGRVRARLWLLLGAAGCVLLIACANVMNVLLARCLQRTREFAVRLAIGGSRWRVVRLLLVESLVLALLGAGGGVLLGVVGVDLLRVLRPVDLPRGELIRLDGPVFAFALALGIASTVVFGLAPALATARRDLVVDLHGARATAGPRQHAVRSALVAAQMGLSLVLLAAGSLLGASLLHLQAVAPGFDPDHLLTFSVSMPGARYERPLGTDRFLRQLEERIRTLPGVEAAGSVWPLPLSGRRWSDLYVAGVVEEGRHAYAELRLATSSLFEALRTPFVEGRTFAASDPRHSVVVSRKLAERAWPGRRALGELLLASPWGGKPEAFRVVGVVEDVRFDSLREPPGDTIYFDARGWSWTDWETNLVVRTAADPAALVSPIRAVLLGLDALVPMAQVRTMRQYLADDLAANRFALALMLAFAVCAVALVALGLYGVVSSGVTERSREIGIRLAFGATRARIVTMVVTQGARLGLVGVGLGLVGASSANRLLASLLYGVEPGDPRILLGAAACLVLIALLAAYLPARRAASVDPAATLRAD